MAGLLSFRRFVPRPRSGSGLPPSSRGGAGIGAGVRLRGWVRWILASGSVSGPGPVWMDFGFRWVGLGRCRRGFGDAVIREAQIT